MAALLPRKCRRAPKVPGTPTLLHYRHGGPCEDCNTQTVKLDFGFACPWCHKIPIFDLVMGVDGKYEPRLEEIPLIDVHPNRAARRQAGRA